MGKLDTDVERLRIRETCVMIPRMSVTGKTREANAYAHSQLKSENRMNKPVAVKFPNHKMHKLKINDIIKLLIRVLLLRAITISMICRFFMNVMVIRILTVTNAIMRSQRNR